ncbi:GGDEF domain-containing protein [Mycolicibacterium mengxianglii]|uniref:GGDEF domain-containing protein n=1 Tax=Mycolicibacterium mengxianglii TaxID=2736649 RepID=UPI0018EF1AFA|nr:GGDEF domain-containing protein [Mycolicibacterium mengxianglii]
MVADVPIVTSIKRWWRQPDSFDWISSYLRARGMVRITRTLIASITLTLALVATVLMFSPDAVEGTGGRLLAWVATGVVFGCGAMWALRWPTKRQSIAFILVINLCIAVVCQVQSDAMTGLIGCVAFAVTGGYIACFHSAGYMAYNFAVTTYLSVLQAARHGFVDDAPMVVAALLLVLLMNTGVPFGLQAVVHVLGIDLLQARHDPLTGLLNRRAFFDRIDEILHTGRFTPCYLVMLMVDLDRFKQLNDTSGHAMGDQALIAVGRVLTSIGRTGVISGRVGGEEFLVADFATVAAPPKLAQRVCDAVAALPFPITASVGSAVGRVDHLTAAGQEELIRDLYTKADEAMYQAKRAGGNQIRHA